MCLHWTFIILFSNLLQNSAIKFSITISTSNSFFIDVAQSLISSLNFSFDVFIPIPTAKYLTISPITLVSVKMPPSFFPL